MDPAVLTAFLESWGYPAFMLLLCATGLGSPVPEDLLLLAAGYLISAGLFSWPVILPLAWCGVIVSDVMLYGIGRRIRAGVSSRWASRLLGSGPRREPAWLARAGAPAVFVARLVPGTRAITFVTAGLHGVPLARFLLYDVLGATLWVPFALRLGTELGEEIGGITELTAALTRTGLWVALTALALLVAWRFWRTEESKL